jgi:flagellar hook-length control protein FliK
MSYENLMSRLGFSTSPQNYTSSIAFKDTDDAVSSKDKRFSDFMDSLEKSNDSRKNKETSSKNEVSYKKEAAYSSTDVKEKHNTDSSSDTSKTAKNNDTDGAVGSGKVTNETETKTTADAGSTPVEGEPQEENIQEASTSDVPPTNTNSEKASSVLIQPTVVTQDQSIQITLVDNLEGKENIEVKTVSPEEIDNLLSGLSEKLGALIDEALSSLTNEASTSTAQSPNIGSSSVDVALVQSPVDSEGEVETLQTGSLLELLSALIGEISEDGSVASESPALQNVISHLQGGENAELTTVLSSLSPEEITELKDQISAYLTGELSVEEQKELIGLLAQHYPTALSPTFQTMTGTPNVMALSGSTGAIGDTPEISGEMQTNVSSEINNTKSTLKQNIAGNAASSENINTQSGDKGENATFASRMDSVKSDDTIKAKVQSDGPVQKDAPASNGAGERFLQSNNAGQISITGNSEAALTQSTLSVSSAVQANSAVGTLSSAGAQSMSAGSTNPATQIVYMTMQKAIKSGEETTIKLQLDPPELGRVDVKMSIDQNNITKIVLTVEKPETHMMLQRDAQFLERAMSDAGLDTQGNLSFDLASNGYTFDRSDSSGDQANAGAEGNSGTEIENAIITQSSTMDWTIDPNTGRMRYNTLV